MKRQRTVRQNRSQLSPFQGQRESEELNSKKKDILLSDFTRLENQNASLKRRCKDMAEIEEERQLALKQNAQLLTENDKMSRYLHQLKSQNQALKKKSESLNAKKYEIAEGMQEDKVSLLKKLQHLQDELAHMQVIKSTEISEVKSQYQINLQSLKRQLTSSQDSYQLEIRRLKEQLNKRENQLLEHGNKLKNISSSTDYEIFKLKEEKQKFKSQIKFKEEDHTKYIEKLKTKLQNNYIEEVEALKRLHYNNLEEIQIENVRLKEALQEKSRHMEQNELKFNKQRAYYEDTIDFIQKDNQCYRRKIYENQKIGHYEMGDLKQQLSLMHQAEIEEIKAKQHVQIQAMQNEIAKLESINKDTNVEIEQMIKDKVAVRNSFDLEYIKCKDEYAQLSQTYKQMELKYDQSISQANSRLSDKQKRITYLQGINLTQKNNAEIQRKGLQQTIISLKQELFNDQKISKQNEHALKEESTNLKNELSQLTTRNEQRENQYQKQINDLKRELAESSDLLGKKINALMTKNQIIDNENQALKSKISLKEKQIINAIQRLNSSSKREDQFQTEINQLRTKLMRKDQQLAQTLQQLKARLQNSFAYSIQSLKSHHQSALKMQANKNHSLQVSLGQKQAQLSDLLIRYKKMTQQIKVLAEQQANKKGITLKFAGPSSDTLTTKNIFDVYLKTKVLGICSDALKENKSS